MELLAFEVCKHSGKLFLFINKIRGLYELCDFRLFTVNHCFQEVARMQDSDDIIYIILINGNPRKTLGQNQLCYFLRVVLYVYRRNIDARR